MTNTKSDALDPVRALCADEPGRRRDPVVAAGRDPVRHHDDEGREGAEVICTVCEDTHRAWSERHGQYFPCTHCPLPCGSCANCGGCGMYCQATPCACACHVKMALVAAFARSTTVPPKVAAHAMVLGYTTSGIWRDGERDFGDEDADQPEPCAMVELTISSGIHSLSVNGIVSL